MGLNNEGQADSFFKVYLPVSWGLNKGMIDIFCYYCTYSSYVVGVVTKLVSFVLLLDSDAIKWFSWTLPGGEGSVD